MGERARDHLEEYTLEAVALQFSVEDILAVHGHQTSLIDDARALVAQPIPDIISEHHHGILHMLTANTSRYQDNEAIRELIKTDPVVQALRERGRQGSSQDIAAALCTRQTTIAYLYTYLPQFFQRV